MKRWTLAAAALLALLGAAYGRPWFALALHAASYPVTASGETANVAIDGTTVFATLAERGFESIDVRTHRHLGVIAPPRGTGSVDDLAVADDFLFALDARPPGFLSVFREGRLVSGPVPVDVGPFSGVSAAHGRVIVSGGTSRMSLRTYDARGQLGGVLATNDFGRGQPDVLLAAGGDRAFVSTHYWGPYFGLTSVRVSNALTKASALDLTTYGFTSGGAKPASFPLQSALDGDALLLADASGLTVVSVADLDAPAVLARLPLPVEAVGIAVRDHVAAVVGSSPVPRLVLIDVDDPATPRIVRSVALPEDSYPTGVAMGATEIAVASHRKGVLFIHR